MKNRIIIVKGTEVTVTTRLEQDYISLTDMVKGFEGGSALIGNWLRAKVTILFLGLGNRSTTRVLITSNSRELKVRPGGTASSCPPSDGYRPRAPLALRPAPGGNLPTVYF